MVGYQASRCQNNALHGEKATIVSHLQLNLDFFLSMWNYFRDFIPTKEWIHKYQYSIL